MINHPLPTHSGYILIVDDTLDNLNLLQATLVEHGYEVRKALNGKMALMGIKAAPPDLILLDVRLPDIDGYDICLHLKASEQTREIPVIFLSALDDVGNKVKAFEVGAVDYITKPFHPQEVLVRVQTQLTLQAAKAEIIQLNTDLEKRVNARTQELRAKNEELMQQIAARQRAEQAQRKQIEQERIIATIAHRIRQSLDINLILSTTVTEVRQFIQSDRVMIFRFNPDWSGHVMFESVTDPKFSLLGKTITDHCFATDYVEAYRQGRIHWIDDLQTAHLSTCHEEFLRNLNVRANLIVPIVIDEILWGLMVAQHCSEPKQWNAPEAELLKQLATQVAIAIQQSELYEHVRQFNVKLEQLVDERTAQLKQALTFEATLNKISETLRDCLDEKTIIQTAVQQLAQELETWSCDLAIYDLDARQSTVKFESIAEGMSSAEGRVFDFDQEALIYSHLIQGDCVQFCWEKEHSYMARKFPNAVAILACPLRDERNILGDLWLFRPHQRCFSDSEVRLVRHVAAQCAIAIRQARLYEAAQDQVRVLESLNVLKDDFLSTVSHELRSPVTNMKMAIQLLVMNLTQAKQILSRDDDHISLCRRIDQYLYILNSECEREIELVNDLLDLQRLETGHQDLDIVPVDLNTLICPLVESFQERATSRQQKLLVSVPNYLPTIDSNPEALSRILSELLHNACKYTPPDERIVLKVSIDRDQFHISVKNFGTDIPSDALPHIFEKFYRVPSSDRWQQGGTGLGLALVQELVKHLNGTIQVDSGSGVTEFSIDLPVYQYAQKTSVTPVHHVSA